MSIDKILYVEASTFERLVIQAFEDLELLTINDEDYA